MHGQATSEGYANGTEDASQFRDSGQEMVASKNVVTWNVHGT